MRGVKRPPPAQAHAPASQGLRAPALAGLVALLLLAGAARGQMAGAPAPPPGTAVSGDTLLVNADTVSGSRAAPKSTTTALILSAILPGAGQFYNESYWKVPVFLGLGTYFAYEFFYALNKYNEFSNLYDLSAQASSGGNERFRTLRDFYRQERDRFGWYFLILYIANLVDAYVDATLSDFKIDDTLSLRVTPLVPGPMPGGVGVGLRLRF
jgi:hypothetical protein